MKDENVVGIVALICAGFFLCFAAQCAADKQAVKVECVIPAQASK